jgi:hypothetical protein
LIYKCGGIDKRTIEKFEKVNPPFPFSHSRFGRVCGFAASSKKFLRILSPLRGSRIGGVCEMQIYATRILCTILRLLHNPISQPSARLALQSVISMASVHLHRLFGPSFAFLTAHC